jgi:hypothetical protein
MRRHLTAEEASRAIGFLQIGLWHNAVQTQCHVRNVNTKMVYSIILIIDLWRTRLATKQLSNTNYNFFILDIDIKFSAQTGTSKPKYLKAK